jgi:hypothetical protein
MIVLKAAPGIRLNEHLEWEDGEAVFRPCLRNGPGRHRIEAPKFDISVGAVTGLA